MKKTVVIFGIISILISIPSFANDNNTIAQSRSGSIINRIFGGNNYRNDNYRNRNENSYRRYDKRYYKREDPYKDRESYNRYQRYNRIYNYDR